MELTTNLKLKKPSDDDFYNVQDFNDNMDKLDEILKDDVGGSSEYVETTLDADSWDVTEKTYSFETDYPTQEYDIELNPRSPMTEAQIDAWSAATIVGSATDNVFTALGEVPTINIPVFLKVVKK